MTKPVLDKDKFRRDLRQDKMKIPVSRQNLLNPVFGESTRCQRVQFTIGIRRVQELRQRRSRFQKGVCEDATKELRHVAEGPP
jgi:hypothetical protein